MINLFDFNQFMGRYEILMKWWAGHKHKATPTRIFQDNIQQFVKSVI
jgi:hypothetical protein